jgi:hypothetical protein
VRTVRAGRSYLVGNPPEVHFGLGGGSGPVTVRIDWPSGQTSTHAVEQLSRWHRWSEPAR